MKIRSIQFIRAFAALAVLVFHVVGAPFVVGAAGVDLFFVISGFIMGMFGNDVPPQRFLFQRIVRVVPLYWAVTLVMCVGAAVGLFSSVSFSFDQLLMSLLFIPYLSHAGEVAPIVLVGWTLNMEMFFYLVFAAGLMLRAPIRFTAAFLGLMVLVGLLFDGSSPLLLTWTSPLLLEFLAGLLLARVRLPGRGDASLMVGTALIWFAVVGYHGVDPSGFARVLAWGVPSVLLVAGCLALENVGAWPKRALAPVETLGDASYSLYLLHGFVITIVYKLSDPGPMAAITIIVLSIVISLLAYYGFEKPATRFLRGLERRPVRYAPSAT